MVWKEKYGVYKWLFHMMLNDFKMQTPVRTEGIIQR